ncbi:substrate-binding periplasmic protein [Rhodococcus wratislaviensis]|uniref:substrate-binding periplasmic protein n=1 Tax=Rhodococcus wratislaviensis TaxID=44752 RepID=UPI003658067F
MSFTDLSLVNPHYLTLCSVGIAAPPITEVVDGKHVGFEPDVAYAIGRFLDLPIRFVDVFRWDDLGATLFDNGCDAILCCQAITPEREKTHLFSNPYSKFDEGLVVRVDSEISSAADLVGRKVGAITGTTNMTLAESFEGAEVVEFGGGDNAFAEMADAVRHGEIDAMVDDELVLPALTEQGDLKIGFVAPTQNSYGLALRPDSAALKDKLDEAVDSLVASGELKTIWSSYFGDKPFPL